MVGSESRNGSDISSAFAGKNVKKKDEKAEGTTGGKRGLDLNFLVIGDESNREKSLFPHFT